MARWQPLTASPATEPTLALTGDISGKGGLIKEGEGTLVLTGTNSYSGITTINDGTLQIANGGATGSITGDVVNNSALVATRLAPPQRFGLGMSPRSCFSRKISARIGAKGP